MLVRVRGAAGRYNGSAVDSLIRVKSEHDCWIAVARSMRTKCIAAKHLAKSAVSSQKSPIIATLFQPSVWPIDPGVLKLTL